MAMFAKRHYEALALVFQETQPYDGERLQVWGTISGEVADMLARDNPQFDRARFIRACEPGANVKARS